MPGVEKPESKTFKSRCLLIIGATLFGFCLDLLLTPRDSRKFGIMTGICFYGGIAASVVLYLLDTIRGRWGR
jgi:hypothetical protein